MYQQYILILKENGTFLFNQYWKQQTKQHWKDYEGIQSIGNEKGKGRWVYRNCTLPFWHKHRRY